MRRLSLTLPLGRFAPRPAQLAGAALLVFAIVVGLGLLRAVEPQLLQRATLWAFDSYQRSQPRAHGGAPAVVVDIDNASLERLGQWPWSRARIARLVDVLRESGAAVIAFDIVFAEPDRTAAGPVIETWRETLAEGTLPLDAGQVARLTQAIDPDARLAEALARTPSVTGFALVGDPLGRLPRRVAGFAWGGSHPAPALRSYRGAVTNLPTLEEAAAGNGDFSIYNDADNLVRRVPLVQSLEGEIYPSLVAESLRLATGATS
ncbi:MAG TPA: CHASE2 domain-containing protein, partial [Kiloniellaceae bacterium]|nr:CHASE2 domain-containing protein [Kiloniellaceae bacterium]